MCLASATCQIGEDEKGNSISPPTPSSTSAVSCQHRHTPHVAPHQNSVFLSGISSSIFISVGKDTQLFSILKEITGNYSKFHLREDIWQRTLRTGTDASFISFESIFNFCMLMKTLRKNGLRSTSERLHGRHAFAPAGRRLRVLSIPRAQPWADSSLAFQAVPSVTSDLRSSAGRWRMKSYRNRADSLLAFQAVPSVTSDLRSSAGRWRMNWYLSGCMFFYQARMRLAFPVVVDADKQDVVAVWCHLVRVLLPLDLADGRIGILVAFQFHDDGR